MSSHGCAREFAVLKVNPDFALMLEARRAALEVTRENARVDAQLRGNVIDQVLRGVREIAREGVKQFQCSELHGESEA